MERSNLIDQTELFLTYLSSLSFSVQSQISLLKRGNICALAIIANFSRILLVFTLSLLLLNSLPWYNYGRRWPGFWQRIIISRRFEFNFDSAVQSVVGHNVSYRLQREHLFLGLFRWGVLVRYHVNFGATSFAFFTCVVGCVRNLFFFV